MEPVFPLHEDNISRFCGLPVCIVTKEGRRHVGVLTHCRSGRVTLNGPMASPTSGGHHAYIDQYHPDTNDKPAKKNNKKNKKATAEEEQPKVQTQAYGNGYDYGYYPWGAAFAVDLALIAFLFLLL